MMNTKRRCLALLFGSVATITAGRAQVNWQLTASAGPIGRWAHAMAFDAAHGQVLLFGGWRLQTNLGDCWTWNGAAWNQAAGGPSARSGHAMCYDPVHGNVVLFGGGNSSGVLADTWIWNGSVWTQVMPSVAPAGRVKHILAFHAASGRCVLIGGFSPNPAAVLDSTWEWDGANWTVHSPPAHPAAHVYYTAADDVAHGRLLLFGNFPAETWAWDGMVWSQLAPANSPVAREGTAMVYDSARQRIVLFGGWDSYIERNDSWDWDGTDWAQRTTAIAPSAREQHAMVYDPLLGAVVLFGGVTSGQSSNPHADTWLYAPTNPATVTPFGTGCPGALGTPTLSAANGALPWLGDSMTLQLDNVPSSAAVLIGGISRVSWGTSSLPMPLASMGMPGCDLEVAPSTTPWMTLVVNQANYSLSVPSNSVLLGMNFYFQGLVLDASANPFGATVSNALTVAPGAR